MSNYTSLPQVHMVAVPTSDFKIVKWCKGKRTSSIKNYCAFPFFYGKNVAGNLIADGVPEMIYGAISTLCVTSDGAAITRYIPKDTRYAISGIPLIEQGRRHTLGSAQKAETLPGGKAWFDLSPFYPTTHIIAGLRAGDSKTIYLAQFSSTARGAAASFDELVDIAQALGFEYAILGDGGGSSVMDIGGKNVSATSGNRVVTHLVRF